MATELVAPDRRRRGLTIAWMVAVVLVAVPLALDLRGHLWGDVRVDLSRRIVTRAGQPVHLTQIEYRLLAMLLSQRGKVLTHRELLREVWGPSHVESNHYLRIYMGHLRQKLEADPAQPAYLLTEIGVGYRFAA